MTFKNSLLVIAISSTLIACGSSSSQGTQTPATSGTTTSGTTTSSNNAIKLTTNIKSGSGKSFSNYKATTNLNQFVISGQTINLTPTGFSSGGFTLLNSATGVNGDNIQRFISGTKYSQSKFGILTQNGSDKVTAFTQGNVTANMPKTGKVDYTGDYVGYDHEKALVGTGTVAMTVNFANKSISGSSSADSNGFPGITLFNGKIEGNKMSINQNGVEAKGQFYGNNASELGGTYNNNGLYTAAFGAKKQ